MAERNNSYLLDGGDSVGMTNEQFKSMLIDQLIVWKRVLEMAVKEGSTNIQKEAQEQIDAINTKLKF